MGVVPRRRLLQHRHWVSSSRRRPPSRQPPCRPCVASPSARPRSVGGGASFEAICIDAMKLVVRILAVWLKQRSAPKTHANARVSGGASCIISHAIDNASAEERSFPSARRRASPESPSTARLGATFSCWSPEPLSEPPPSRSLASSPLSSGPSRLASAPAACAFPEVVPATSRSPSAATAPTRRASARA